MSGIFSRFSLNADGRYVSLRTGPGPENSGTLTPYQAMLGAEVMSVYSSAAASEVIGKAWYQPFIDVLQRFFDSLKKTFNAFTTTGCDLADQEELQNEQDASLRNALLEIDREGLLNDKDARYLSTLRYPDWPYAGQHHQLTLILNKRIDGLPADKKGIICSAITYLAEAVKKEAYLGRFLAEELLCSLLKEYACSMKAALAAGWDDAQQGELNKVMVAWLCAWQGKPDQHVDMTGDLYQAKTGLELEWQEMSEDFKQKAITNAASLMGAVKTTKDKVQTAREEVTKEVKIEW